MIIDAARPEALVVKDRIKLDGDPKGYAVDATHSVYTNLEDQDRTLGMDVKTRKVRTTWRPECGKVGPRGLAIAPTRQLLFVACTNGAVALGIKDGVVRGRIETGAGVDNIVFSPKTSLLYVASGKSETLTLARVAATGAMQRLASAPTAEGARVVVVDAAGSPTPRTRAAAGCSWCVRRIRS